jgi:hypothetical protein
LSSPCSAATGSAIISARAAGPPATASSKAVEAIGRRAAFPGGRRWSLTVEHGAVFGRVASFPFSVMPGLVPGIHVDGRAQPAGRFAPAG